MIQTLRYCAILITLFILSSQAGLSQTNSYSIRYTSNTRFFEASKEIKTKDNGTLIAGMYDTRQEDSADVMLIKLDEGGSVVWSKALALSERIWSYILIEMADGNFALAASLEEPVKYTSDILLMKFDCRGNVIWSNILTTATTLPDRGWTIESLTEGKDGDLIVSYAMMQRQGFLSTLCRVNSAGSIVWSKSYIGMDPDGNTPQKVFYKKDKLIVFAYQLIDKNFIALDRLIGAMKLNYDNGAIELQKTYFFKEEQTTLSIGSGGSFDAEQLSDNGYALFGRWSMATYSDVYLYKIIVDDDLNFKSSQLYHTSYDIGLWSQINVLPNGDLHIHSQDYEQAGFYWYTADNSNNTIRSKKIPYPNAILYSWYEASMAPGFYNNRTASFFINEIKGPSYGIDVFQVAENDLSVQSCIGVDTSFVTSRALPVTLDHTWSWKSVQDNTVTATPLTMPSMAVPVSAQYFCGSNNPPSFKIVGPAAICKPGITYTYHITTSNKGYKPVQWNMDPSYYQSFQVINDSSVAITFKDAATGPYQAALYAQGGDCVIKKDTLLIDVVPGPTLPRFVNICTQPIELDPGNWFASYRWQDGSTSQKYTVTEPGRYIVQITTRCNEIITDTVDAFKNKTGQLPNAVSICKKDTLLLQAPAGFTNYSWGPGYTGRDIYIPGQTDTFYVLHSTTIDGCPLNDTVNVKINQLPSIHLVDTFVCVQDDLELNVGNGFKSYAWNTGATSSTLIVTAAGTYSVAVTDLNGCIARDTVLVTSKDCPKRFYMPNAFSPNGDGKNETFKPHIEGRLDVFEMAIYNRWGGVIYRTNNAALGWNGNVNGYIQSTGTYIWVCRYKFRNDTEKVEKGVVLLVK